jgi:hypothetical protein
VCQTAGARGLQRRLPPVAPAALHACTIRQPVPPAAACTNTTSPAATGYTRRVSTIAVRPWSRAAQEVSEGKEWGTGTQWLECSATYWAYEALLGVRQATRSPALKLLSEGAETTTPAPSRPAGGLQGGGTAGGRRRRARQGLGVDGAIGRHKKWNSLDSGVTRNVGQLSRVEARSEVSVDEVYAGVLQFDEEVAGRRDGYGHIAPQLQR